ncbi:hypothetical protein ASPWEDRAFT_482593 [Aspergillus wentii DTO 134E9]|uniref:Uncharacterized protein n=1 Tax=Aspergillus wentii DTO 134E9 TaxID=1073089 RepID=A0A1L9RJ67_ASPWE|nr:uncharacterized protein ASPWEDRAFT_482593 [Aspergillus wentii DTO 134E9]OJJ34898.1 hypothetical protein ASPWEDRAFT_482593 [Aspergillus wentii DTO 134E9]
MSWYVSSLALLNRCVGADEKYEYIDKNLLPRHSTFLFDRQLLIAEDWTLASKFEYSTDVGNVLWAKNRYTYQ